MKHHAADGDFRLENLEQMPRDRLSFAVFVCREQHARRLLQQLLEFGDMGALVRIDDI